MFISSEQHHNEKKLSGCQNHDICVHSLKPKQLKHVSSNYSTQSQLATFDIPVDLFLRVQVLQALEDLS